MSEAPFVNFYTSDFLAGTGGMTAATKGVYITLLCLLYEAERPLTQSRDVLARRCGCTVPAFEKALDVLCDEGKIERGPDGIWSKKCEKHIASRRERRSSAKAAAEKRWKKAEGKQGAADARASSAQCKPEPEPEIEYKEANASLSPDGDEPFFPKPLDDVAEAVAAYNAAASQSGWPEVRILSKSRRSALAARLRECGGLEGWACALAKAQASAHCCGQNDRGWVASFDFLTRQSSFAKLMEGNYDNRTNAPSSLASDPFLRAAARRMAGRSG
jgi:uncharacterized protein YdaU (DUF1376 family)